MDLTPGSLNPEATEQDCMREHWYRGQWLVPGQMVGDSVHVNAPTDEVAAETGGALLSQQSLEEGEFYRKTGFANATSYYGTRFIGKNDEEGSGWLVKRRFKCVPQV